MTSKNDEEAVLFDCLARFIALSSMYSTDAIQNVRDRIQRQLKENNYEHEDAFLIACDLFLKAEDRR